MFFFMAGSSTRTKGCVVTNRIKWNKEILLGIWQLITFSSDWSLGTLLLNQYRLPMIQYRGFFLFSDFLIVFTFWCLLEKKEMRGKIWKTITEKKIKEKKKEYEVVTGLPSSSDEIFPLTLGNLPLLVNEPIFLFSLSFIKI